MSRNRVLRLRIPVDAPLEQVIDWEHPLLRGVPGANPGERLLAAWRRRQGYTYYFDREQIDDLLKRIPDDNWDAYERTLAAFLPGGDRRRAPVPLDDRGRINWFCYTRRNQEYVCSVNRFGWLLGMAAAARRSGRPEAAAAVFSVMDSWIESCPAPAALILGREGVWKYWYAPWAPFNTAERANYWTMAFHLLWDSPALTPERFGRYVLALRQHLIFLGRVPPRIDRSARGNHFLVESRGLLHASLLPWLREAAAAREVALHNYGRCLRQILPDGVHLERAPGYHRGCIRWFTLPLLLCRLNRWPLPAGALRKIAGMLNFALHASSPDGACSNIADAGGHGDGYQTEQLVARLTGWTLPVRGTPPKGEMLFAVNTPPPSKVKARPFSLSCYFPHGGYAAARSSWSPEASAVLMKLDGYGGGHSHADFFSFTFAFRGRSIIDEMGTRAYDNDRASVACKWTAAHNVVLIGDREMCDPGDDLHYFGRRPPIVRFADVFAVPKRDGYLRAGGKAIWRDGAWWRRELEFSPSGCLCIRDEVGRCRREAVRIQFYLLSANVRREGPLSFVTDDEGVPNIRLTVAGSPAVRASAKAAAIYRSSFHGVPATLLTFRAPSVESGSWETVIEGR